MDSKKQPIRVFLDSNIYFQNRYLENPNGTWLLNLNSIDKVEIVLPLVVESEVRSHLEDQRNVHVKTVNDFEQFLYKNGLGKESLFQELSGIKSNITSNFDKKIKEFFDNKIFVKENNFKEHVESVFNEYFLGQGSFSEKKKRDDIPDAFIYHFLKNKNEAVCVTSDNKLREKLNNLPNLKIYSNLESFLESDEIKSYIDNFENEKTSLNRKKELVDSFYSKYFKSEKAQNDYKESITKRLNYQFLANKNKDFPFDYVQVWNLKKVEFPSFENYNFSYLPDDTLAISFKIKIDCTLARNEIFFGKKDPSLMTVEAYPRMYEFNDLEVAYTLQYTDKGTGFPKQKLSDYVVPPSKTAQDFMEFTNFYLANEGLQLIFSTVEIQ
nr:hypothetical protein BHI3_13370 [Bacteriovorax sp. HI3]